MSQIDPSSAIAQLERLRVLPRHGADAFELMCVLGYFDPNLDVPTDLFSFTTKLIQVLVNFELLEVHNDNYTRFRLRLPIVSAILRFAEAGKFIPRALGYLTTGLALKRAGRLWDDERRDNRRGRIKIYASHALCVWDHILKLENKTLMAHPFFHVLCSRFDQLGLHEMLLEVTEKALPIMIRAIGPFHVQTLQTKGDMAAALWRLQRHDEAMEILNETLPLALLSLGSNHQVTLDLRNEIGIILFAEGRLDEALEIAVDLSRICLEICGGEHTSTLTLNMTKGKILFKMDRYAEALDVFKAIYDTQRRVIGEMSLGKIKRI